MGHQISLVGIALSAGLVTIIPTFVAFAFGEVDTDNGDEFFFLHGIRFVILGVLLFLPVMVLTMEALEAKSEIVGGVALLIWFGSGVITYWVTYVAGTSMRQIWDM